MKRFTSPLITAGIASLLAASISFMSVPAASADSTSDAGLHFLGRYVTKAGIGGARVSAYDPATSRLYVANNVARTIDVVNISRPTKPVKVGTINLAAKGATAVLSVAAKDGLVAIGTSMTSAQANGRVFFTNTDGKFLSSAATGIEVGSQPRDLEFSPDGRYVLSANQGQPSSYCKTSGALPTTTDPNGSVSIIDVSTNTPSAATTVNFESFNDRTGALVYQGGRVFGPGATLAQDLEPTSITLSSNSKYAYVTMAANNVMATIDMGSKTVISLAGFGQRDFSKSGFGLDAVVDSVASVKNQTAYGLYQPLDAATLVGSDGTNYVVTANGGAPRSYPCLMGGTSPTTVENESAALSSVYDPADSTITTVKNTIGGLQVTPFAPANPQVVAISASTKVTKAYAFGSRSFSVWQPDNLDGVAVATQVWDSGESVENVTAAAHPAQFNAGWNTTTGTINAADTLSTGSGAQPSAVATGSAYGLQWLAVGLKGDGGVMLYDASNPLAPTYFDYSNKMVVTGNIVSGKTAATAGDVSPESITFVSPAESPTGSALLLVSYSGSGTVGIFEIPSNVPSAPRQVAAKLAAGKLTVKFAAPASRGWGSSLSYKVACKSTKGSVSATADASPVSIDVPASKRGRAFACSVRALSRFGSGPAATAIVK
jgi:hypothetical protein